MYAVSDRFLRALRYTHKPRFYVAAYQDGVQVTPDRYASSGLPVVIGATVNVDGSQHVRRTLTCTIAAPDLTPHTAADLLTPYGTELRVWRGIEFPNKVEYCPLGVFVIQEPEDTQSGSAGASGVTITAADRASYIADARLIGTVQSKPGTVVAEIRRLVADAVPAHVPAMVDETRDRTPCPAMVYDDRDRAAAIDKLAASIGAELVFTVGGVPTLRRVPALSDPIAWTVNAGASGVLLEAKTSVSREHIANAVVASGSSLDGGATVTATAYDTNPDSPTRWGGRFGKKPAFFSSPVLTTVAQCQWAATSRLSQYVGAGWTLSLTTLPNPALTDGDVLLIRLPDGRTARHIVDTLSIGLDPTAAMPIGTRSLDLPIDETS